MNTKIKGLHHITAVSGPPQKNYDFYRNTIGLRFTKKTVNFDDPTTYHLYYGNYNATPGSSITFFPWTHVGQGSPSTGEATVVDYAIPVNSISYWKNRFDKLEIKYENQTTLFGFHMLPLQDNDGMMIRLVEDKRVNAFETKGMGEVNDTHAIRGFFGTTLSLADPGRTAELLSEFGWEHSGSENEINRYTSEPDNNLGTVVDLKKDPNLNGRFGRGSIHHIAFRVPDDELQAEWREKLIKMGFQVTPVQNRDYFRSIYFREPGGVLFEIATDSPGFMKDEPLDKLGEKLQLPAWYEKKRQQIESQLPPINT
ncbi:ring-cleaving dioxygenase [soil metagenome]